MHKGSSCQPWFDHTKGKHAIPIDATNNAQSYVYPFWMVGTTTHRIGTSSTSNGCQKVLQRGNKTRLQKQQLKCQMYQDENNARGCKVKTSSPNKEWNGTNSIKHQRGASSVLCSSNETHCVLSAMELAKWLTTSSRSSKVVMRWNGTTFKQCVIDVTM